MNSETKIPSKAEEKKSFCLRNAYRVKPAMEYNPGKSLRHPIGMKMYAELTGIKP